MPTADFDDSFINWPDDPPSLSLSLPLSSRPHPSVHPAIVDLGLQSAAPVLKYEQNPLQSSLAHGGIDYRPAHAYHHSAMPDLSHANFMRASMDAIGPNPYASASSGDGHYGLVMGDGAGGGGGMHAGGAWHSDQSDSSASLSAQLYTTSPSSSARPSAALQAGKTEASLQFVREHALSLLAHGPEVLTRYHGIEVHLPDASSSMPLDDDTAADSNEHLGPGAGECKVQIVPGAYIRSPGCITLLAETWMRPDKCTHDFLISGSQTGVELHYPIHELANLSTTVALHNAPHPSMKPLLRAMVPHSDMIDPLMYWLHHNDEQVLYEDLLDRCDARGVECIVQFCTNVQYFGVCDHRIRAVVLALFEPTFPNA